MRRFKLLPLLGLKTDVPADSPILLRPLSEDSAISYDTGGVNVSYRREPGSCSKSYGYSAWSNSAIGSATGCQGMFELEYASYRDNIFWDHGLVYSYDATPDPVQITAAALNYDGQTGEFAVGLTLTGGTSGTTATIARVVDSGTTGTLMLQTISGSGFQDNEAITDSGTGAAVANGTVSNVVFSTAPGDLMSMIKHTSYVIWADRHYSEPYKWRHTDQRMTPLITLKGATIYKFDYLVEWQRRIIGAYTTVSDIEIRYTDALPTLTALEFPTANQLYKPTTDKITGISKMGTNALYLYGEYSISKVEYTGNATLPFYITSMIDDQGCASHHSIINVFGTNYFFNRDYGFVNYPGGTSLVPSDCISRDIDDLIQGIDPTYYKYIVGKHLPLQKELAWLVPLAGASSPSHILYYNLDDSTWRYENYAATFIDAWTRASTEYRKPVFGAADGHTYQITGDTLPSTANLDGYRVEPILDFGFPYNQKIVRELWFEIVSGGNYSLDVYYRAGDTTKEVLAASWTSVGSLSLNSPAEPKLNCDILGRKIQIKWGTNVDSEYFSVNGIHFVYDIESSY